jgi:predicted RNA-binding Zn-ribbon protein involved in translation (DUF1610 family)
MEKYYHYLKYLKKEGKRKIKENKLRALKKKIGEEKRKGGFRCIHCGIFVSEKAFGTKHRNHCPNCLWSVHLGKIENLREACGGSMIPIGFTFKKEGIDKYTGKPKKGEIMVIHQCLKCGKISINRLAGDDRSDVVMKIFEYSLQMPEALQKQLRKEKIEILTEKDREEIKRQLGIN